jgi:hypothetical protein
LKKSILKSDDPKFDPTRNKTWQKKESDLTRDNMKPDIIRYQMTWIPTRPDPRLPETRYYLISDDLNPDPIRTRMTQNPRWPELIRTRRKPDCVQSETRPDKDQIDPNPTRNPIFFIKFIRPDPPNCYL